MPKGEQIDEIPIRMFGPPDPGPDTRSRGVSEQGKCVYIALFWKKKPRSVLFVAGHQGFFAIPSRLRNAYSLFHP